MSDQVQVKGPDDVVLPADPAHIKRCIFELRKMVQRYKADAERETKENAYLRHHVRRLNNIITEMQGKTISQSL